MKSRPVSRSRASARPNQSRAITYDRKGIEWAKAEIGLEPFKPDSLRGLHRRRPGLAYPSLERQ